ncbi:MAG TPA: DUF1351 domain-containing protein [Smithellaceae bacterium]|nr:DUF1351 domain-containing protein [Smithellaceae bacterium]
MGLELILKTDIENLQPIEFNYDNLKSALNVKLERYRNLVIEDKDVPDAKKDRAELNKLADALNSEKIRVKKMCLEPYNDFEKKVKELIGMVNGPVSEIDGKIKKFEARKKKEKRDTLERFYKDNVKDLGEILTFDKIYNIKWETAAAKVVDITQEMMTTFERVKTDLNAIKSMKMKHETPVISKYLERLNLGDALAEDIRLRAMDEKAAELKAPEALPTHRLHIEANAQEAEPEQEPENVQTSEPSNPQEEFKAEEPVIMTDFRVWATSAQLQVLAAFLKSNNIKYGRVPTEQKEAI